MGKDFAKFANSDLLTTEQAAELPFHQPMTNTHGNYSMTCAITFSIL